MTDTGTEAIRQFTVDLQEALDRLRSHIPAAAGETAATAPRPWATMTATERWYKLHGSVLHDLAVATDYRRGVPVEFRDFLSIARRRGYVRSAYAALYTPHGVPRRSMLDYDRAAGTIMITEHGWNALDIATRYLADRGIDIAAPNL